MPNVDRNAPVQTCYCKECLRRQNAIDALVVAAEKIIKSNFDFWLETGRTATPLEAEWLKILQDAIKKAKEVSDDEK
jgi:hypothetical protein